MTKVTSKEKLKISQKLYKLQRKGLVSYGKYLEKEFANSKGKSNKKSYHKYIKNEIARNKARLKKVDSKL